MYYYDGADCEWAQEEFDLAQFIAHRLPDRDICELVSMLINGFHVDCFKTKRNQLVSLACRRIKKPEFSEGPLVLLPGNFHPSMLKWCSMHSLGLGILFTANGASLPLVPCLAAFA